MPDDKWSVREIALDQAIRIAITVGMKNPLDIVAMADTFLLFLKGEEQPEPTGLSMVKP